MSDTYRKMIKERIAKLHTAIGMKANPLLDSDLGADIVADIARTILREQANEANKQPHIEALPLHGVVFSDQKERSRFQKDIDDCYAHEDEEENEAEVCSYCKGEGWVVESGVKRPCVVCYMNGQT